MQGGKVCGWSLSQLVPEHSDPATQAFLSPVTPLVARAFSSNSPTIWILSVINAIF